jgi:hypothetical protein
MLLCLSRRAQRRAGLSRHLGQAVILRSSGDGTVDDARRVGGEVQPTARRNNPNCKAVLRRQRSPVKKSAPVGTSSPPWMGNCCQR